ncbi:MAG: sulfur carrier protein ThiS [Gammaproteobacteria bacterium]|nr:sulfur carrier protein ThiS [Gammaproteobacteria bacterium]NIM74146.1 sulfur carrier protein ThiS [Gammaproteobacteria bacterium]NIN39029.1 sulfur carrier protein ThiS [Gammaproteobacteria bacterium]NIO25922.1 sulfur carrier protein ThiS [Gammaproteobacteria bacterium]NIO66553.1 sulfur carrier protein ThiS [Gammaproteobacteria bacterium]
MNIVLNGEQRGLADALTVLGLIEQLELAGKRLAVEVNEEVIPRSQHEVFRLKEGDRVEIVQAIGGG